MNKYKVVTYYPPEDEGFDGDYYEVSVELLTPQKNRTINGVSTLELRMKFVELIRYGDYYHDKGQERAEAFVQGHAFGQKHEVIYEQRHLEEQ